MAEGIEHQNRSNGTSGDSNGTNTNNTSNDLHQAEEQARIVQTPQDAHTREKLFDFIALLQGRRMDDQRATLKP